MNWLRRWVAWTFLIATIVAQGPHDHRPASHLSAAEFGTCDSPSPHWAGHEADPPDGGPDACPLCQHRLQPALVVPSLALIAPACSAPLDAWPVAQRALDPPLRLRCRAPPRA